MNIPEEIKKARTKTKIKNIGRQAASDIVNYFAVMLGLRDEKIPDGMDKANLVNYIFERCGESTLEEVKLAVNLYIQGKLDYNKELYDRLSALFIENVIQSYNRYRLNFIQPIRDTDDEIPLTWEQKQKIIEDGLLNQFEIYRNKKKLIDFGVGYNQMVKRGILRMTYSQIKECIRLAKYEVALENTRQSNTFMSIAQLRSMYHKSKSKFNTDVRIKTKWIALKLLYDDIIDNGGTLEYYLNFNKINKEN